MNGVFTQSGEGEGSGQNGVLTGFPHHLTRIGAYFRVKSRRILSI
jgi:hypothetical protein